MLFYHRRSCCPVVDVQFLSVPVLGRVALSVLKYFRIGLLSGTGDHIHIPRPGLVQNQRKQTKRVGELLRRDQSAASVYILTNHQTTIRVYFISAILMFMDFHDSFWFRSFRIKIQWILLLKYFSIFFVQI